MTEDEFSFDDFYFTSFKKEKSKRVKNQKIDQEWIETELIKKIQNLSIITEESKNDLVQLVNQRKILNIFGANKTEDDCVTIPAKINTRLEIFSGFLSDDIKLKVFPKNMFSCNVEAFRFLRGFNFKKGRKSRKCSLPNYEKSLNLVEEKLDIFAQGSIRLLKTFPDALTLQEMTLKHPTKVSKIIEELLEICCSKVTVYNFWKCKQDLQENVIYHNNKWIIINTSRYSFHGNEGSLANNLQRLASILESEEKFVKILKKNFSNCDENCTFMKTCTKIFIKDTKND